MKTIGVLGGLGPQATMDFDAPVHAVSQPLIPQVANTGYPPMLVTYLRCLPMVLKGVRDLDAFTRPSPTNRPPSATADVRM